MLLLLRNAILTAPIVVLIILSPSTLLVAYSTGKKASIRMSGFQQLCLACRTGDVDDVDKLLSAGVDPNQQDPFQNTPLFLASLCGHEAVVKTLLTGGARCDTDRQEGARCVYGALTDTIRTLLIQFDLSKSSDTGLPFATHLRSLLDSEELTQDVVVVGGGQQRRAHRFLLAARCVPYREILERTGKTTLEQDATAFQLIVNYVYLWFDPTEINKLSRTEQEETIHRMKELDLVEFAESLEKWIETADPRARSKLMKEIQLKILERARTDLQQLVELIIQYKGHLRESLNFKTSGIFPDIVLSVKNSTFYPVHRSILARDEYFKVMFQSDFLEAQDFKITQDNLIDTSVLPIINFPVDDVEIAEIIIKFLYYDNSEIPYDLALDVVVAADLLLNDRLKSMAAVTITNHPEIPSRSKLFEILKTGWSTRLDRLEHYVAKIIAYDLDNYVHDEEFADIILESSERIQQREETDTIELIDDIRFYLAKKWKIDFEGLFEGEENELIETSPDYEFYQQDLMKIEDLLTNLQLNA